MRRSKFSNEYKVSRKFLTEETINFFKMSTLLAFKNDLGYDNITLDNLTFTEIHDDSETDAGEWAKYYVVAELSEEIEVPEHMAKEFQEKFSRIIED